MSYEPVIGPGRMPVTQMTECRHLQWHASYIATVCAAEGVYWEVPNLPMVQQTMIDRLPTWLVTLWLVHWTNKLLAAPTPGHTAAATVAVTVLREQLQKRGSDG